MTSLAADSDPCSQYYCAPRVQKTGGAGRPAALEVADDATDTTAVPSLPSSPQSSIFAQVKKEEFERAKVKDSRYQPAAATNSGSLQKSLLEFDRRLREDTYENDKIYWVLVATRCDQIPKTSKMTELLDSTGLSKTYSGVKFCLTEDHCLYIVSFSDKDRHGAGIECLFDALKTFSKTVLNDRLFHTHTNVIAQVDEKRTAPDAA